MNTNKVFFHAGAPCRGCGGLEEMWAKLDAAGIRFGVYSVEDGGMAGVSAVRYAHADPIIFRVLATDVAPYHLTPQAAAEAQWALLLSRLPAEVMANKSRIWIELGNEQDKGRADWLGHYYVALAGLALAQGYRLCGPGWSTGEPEPEHWRTPGWLAYLRLCAKHPERLAVTVHEYSLEADDVMASAPWLVGRFQDLFAACDENGIARPVVFVTEAGWTHDDLPHAEKAKADIDALARLYARFPQVKAAFLWTLIGGGDKITLAAELNALMPWLTEYSLATRFPEVEAPPAPEPPPPAEEPEPPPLPGGNLLVNGSFEEGWTDAATFPGQHPKGWVVEWNAGREFHNPHAEWEYQVGEGVHKSPDFLPAEEHAVFIWDGRWTYKLFADKKAFWARLKQTVELPAGRYRLSTPVWVDCYRWMGFKDYDVEPWQAEIKVNVNNSAAREWSPLPSGGKRAVVTEFEHPGGPMKLGVHLRANWPISNNLWLDRWELAAVRVPEVPPVEPEPEPPPPAPPDDRPVLILDVSKWQETISPEKMKAAGVDGVILRASYGGSKGSAADELVDVFAPQLEAAGIPFGLYHYFHPARPVGEQFAAFKRVVDKYGYRMRLALDLEELEGLDGATAAKALEFLRLMDEAYPLPDGKRHLVYTSMGYWRQMGSPAWGSEYELWIAAWTTAARPIVPGPWSRWMVWQHTSKGNGPAHGVGSARVDLNRFNGSRAEFEAWLVDGAAGPPVKSFAAELWENAAGRPVWTWEPEFALAKAILTDGLMPAGGEFRFEFDGKVWFYQIALSGDRKTRRVYYVERDKWNAVKWIAGPVEPEPAPPPKPPVGGEAIDLLRFKVADPDCWRVVRNPEGQQEDVQDMALGEGRFVRRKNDLGEWHSYDGEFFYLLHDTSPAPGAEGIERVYTLQKGGRSGAPKSKRFQKVGEVWRETGTHWVQFRAKGDCRPLGENTGAARNESTIVRYARNYTFNSYGQNLTFDEVIWEKTGVETQIYGRMGGRSCGWIGWEAPWGKCEPVEIRWDRGRMTREPERVCGF